MLNAGGLVASTTVGGIADGGHVGRWRVVGFARTVEPRLLLGGRALLAALHLTQVGDLRLVRVALRRVRAG